MYSIEGLMRNMKFLEVFHFLVLPVASTTWMPSMSSKWPYVSARVADCDCRMWSMEAALECPRLTTYEESRVALEESMIPVLVDVMEDGVASCRGCFRRDIAAVR